MSDDQALLDLVDQLTKPHRATFWQGTAVRHRLDDSLLEQLRCAVVGDLGGGRGASKPARERTPMDVLAFSLLEEVDGRVRSWLIDMGQPHAGGVGHLLRAWYVVFVRSERDETTIGRHHAVLAGWVKRIRDIIDPPDRIELTDPCPRCGQMWVTRGHGEDAESVRALWATYREPQDESDASCQGCGHSWRGITGMRRLRIELDEKQSASLA